MCTPFGNLCVINVWSPYGLNGVPIYILYLYDQIEVGWRVVGITDQLILQNVKNVRGVQEEQ